MGFVIVALVICALIAIMASSLLTQAELQAPEPNATIAPSVEPPVPDGPLAMVYSFGATVDLNLPGPVCSGENDQETISRELAAAGNRGGGIVQLTAGRFVCSGSVRIPANVRLAGAGQGATVLEFADTGDVHLLGRDAYADDFTVTGAGLVRVTADRCTVRNVTATTTSERWAAFGVQVTSPSGTLREIAFIDCSAINCGTAGFMLTAKNDSGTVKDTMFLRCTALNVGAKTRFNEWVVGFSLPERGNVENISVIQCHAEGCWESGFHVESEPGKVGVQLSDCTSVRNGQRRHLGGETPDYGAGFVVSGDMHLTRCHSTANEIGFLCVDGGSFIEECDDTGSEIGILIKEISASSPLTIERTRIANATIPISIASTSDDPFTAVSLRGLTIRGEEPGAGAAVVVRGVSNPGAISISDTTINGYPAGIADSGSGQVARRNVTVDGLALDTV